MRKIALLMFAIVFLLCGCNMQKTVSPVTKGIKFTLNITCGETKYNIAAHIDKGGCMEAVVNSPKEIKGMKITSNRFETLSEFKNLKYTYNEDEFSGDNYIIMVYNILSSLENKKLSFKNGENCVLNGSFSGEKYIFVFSPSGLPIELNMDSKDLKAEFNDIGII